jgi:hypothetical protein
MNAAARADLLRNLKERLSQIEHSHRLVQGTTFSTGISQLDRLFPGKGLEWGTVIEWLSEGEGTGAATLALAVAANVVKRHGAFVVVDGQREFYPPAAAGFGIPLEQTVVAQPGSAREALWTLEQSLRSSAVAVAMGWIERLNDRTFRRLQVAAETGGSLGFLLRPVVCRREPSWAEARLLVKGLPQSGPCLSPGRRWRVELLHGRGAAGGGVVELELSDEAGNVRLVS